MILLFRKKKPLVETLITAVVGNHFSVLIYTYEILVLYFQKIFAKKCCKNKDENVHRYAIRGGKKERD